MTQRRHVLLCYDIADSTRLRRVHKTVRDFGRPLQYSVFACRLTALDRARLEALLLDIIKSNEDQIVLIDLGRADRDDSAVPGARMLGLAEGGRCVGPVVL